MLEYEWTWLYHKSQPPAVLQRKNSRSAMVVGGSWSPTLPNSSYTSGFGQHRKQMKTGECEGVRYLKTKDDDFSRRRTRVVECPSGIDVSGVNALSVAEFLSTVTQQQTGWRDLKVSWSIHHSRFNCEGYRDVERAWKNLTSHMQIMFDAAVYQCFSSAEARPANRQRNMDMTWQRA